MMTQRDGRRSLAIAMTLTLILSTSCAGDADKGPANPQPQDIGGDGKKTWLDAATEEPEVEDK